MPWGKLYWIIGPDYQLPRREFTYIKDFLIKLDAIASKASISEPKEGSCSLVTKTGQVVITRTAADLKKIAADPVDGIIVTEAGQCDMGVVFKAMGRTSETRGFIHLEGTFERSDLWYSQLYYEFEYPPGFENPMGGISFRMPTWDNVIVFPGGRNDPEIKLLEEAYSKVPGLFDERIAALPSSPMGLIFKEFRLSRHVNNDIEFRPNIPVYLGIDPADGGPSAYAVIACQFLPMPSTDDSDVLQDPDTYCNVIDAVYLPFSTAEDIIPECASRPWWNMVLGGSIDVESPGERKRWAAMAGITLTARKIPIREGEQRLHTFLSYDKDDLSSRPALQISSDVPNPVINEFTSYKTAVSTAAEMQNKPTSTAKSRRGQAHALKALWYLLYGRFGPVKFRVKVPTIRQRVRRLARSVGLNYY